MYRRPLGLSMTVVLAGLLLASLAGVVQSQGPALQQAGSGGCEAGATYDPRCDVNRDGETNVVDLQLVATHWGQSGTWSSDGWLLTGNAGTTPGTHFLGTTDAVTLTLAVSNTTALRLAPSSGTPNLIGGYSGNSVTAGVVGATIGGGGDDQGDENLVTDDYGTVGGGRNNQAGDNDAVTFNDAIGATVAGGTNNTASGPGDTVGGGQFNTASGGIATVGGGVGNKASGFAATVPGGSFNTAAGHYSFAAGRRTKANNPGCFVWGDSTNADITCDNDNRTIFRSTGGFYIYTNSGLSSGAYLAAGSGTWASLSDVNAKRDFRPIEPQQILASVAQLPISTWAYRDEPGNVRHIGPTAQDFYAAFGLGADETHITTVDADGVALAAIQGLYQQVQELQHENQVLKQENANQQSQIDDLQARLAALEQQVGGASAPASAVPNAGLAFGGLALLGGAIYLRRKEGGQQ